MTELRKKTINMYQYYNPKSDLHNITDVNLNMVNTFDIDFYFMKKAYPYLENKTNDQLIDYIKERNLSELFFHSKQLINIFDDQIKLKKFKDNIYVNYKNADHLLSEFIKSISTFTYDIYKNSLLTKIKNNNFSSDELLIALFIGNIDIGISILTKISLYSKKQKFQLAICVKKSIYNNSQFKEINDFLKNNDMNYILYTSNELGNDVTPTLLMYDDIRSSYHFDYIMKIHTKTDDTMRTSLLNGLLGYTLDKAKIKMQNNSKSGCFGSIKYYTDVKDDTLNKELYKKFNHLLHYDHFLAGTIFLSNFVGMDNMLVFLKANYLSIFTQNTYDNNQINKHHSYSHFMERLFGLINNKTPLLAIPIK